MPSFTSRSAVDRMIAMGALSRIGILLLCIGAACKVPNATDDPNVDSGVFGPRCGDGHLDPGEICDDGNTASGDGCATDCKSDEACGNGMIDVAAAELCDDGNTLGDDGCSADCLSDETCGNGIV